MPDLKSAQCNKKIKDHINYDRKNLLPVNEHFSLEVMINLGIWKFSDFPQILIARKATGQEWEKYAGTKLEFIIQQEALTKDYKSSLLNRLQLHNNKSATYS